MSMDTKFLEFLNHIDQEYNKSITTIRHLMTTNKFTNEEKIVIAKKILLNLEKMKSEVLPWTQ